MKMERRSKEDGRRKSKEDKRRQSADRRPSTERPKPQRPGSRRSQNKSADHKRSPSPSKARSSKDRFLDLIRGQSTPRRKSKDATGGAASTSTASARQKQRARKAEDWMTRWKEEEIGVEWEELQETYQTLPSGATTAAFDTADPKKKRYTAVKLLDSTRVKLTAVPNLIRHEFIHASFVTRTGGGTFILASAPTKDTVVDFWSMIYQQKIVVIVMLCQLVEDGKTKCERYFPESKDKALVLQPLNAAGAGRKAVVEIQLEQEETLSIPGAPDEVIESRTLTLCYPDRLGTQKRRVHHFQYTTWPDQGVPANPLGVAHLQLVVGSLMEEAVSSQRATIETPLLIHCSAGIGRSGTFAVIDNVIRSLTGDHPEVPSVPEMVRQVRKERLLAVQTSVQYTFTYAVVVAALKERGLLDKNAKVPTISS